MSQLTFKTDHEELDLRSDPNGFLFDPRIREFLARQGRNVDPGTEALAAVRILGKRLHMTMERWAERFGLSEGRFQILVRLKHQPPLRSRQSQRQPAIGEGLAAEPEAAVG
jgi:hypothetical protein